MKKVIRLTESDLVRIVKKVLSEDTKHTISKPNDYIKFQEKCQTKDNGSFRTFVDGIHLRCMGEEGSTFHPIKSEGLIVKDNPFGRVGVIGTWKLNGNKIELRSTL